MTIERNPEAPTNDARAKRGKPRRQLGQVVTRKRRLQNEALESAIAARKEMARNAARNEMQRLREAQKARENPVDQQGQWQNNVLRTVVSNQTALLRAWGFQKVGVQCNLSPQTQNVVAWTDFDRINVTWPTSKMPSRFDNEKVRDTIAQMKGIMQHEMGHVRFTTGWKTILMGANMPKLYADDPVKSALLMRCWNMIEDQRMESLVVEAVPRIANYFGTMVANVVMGGNKDAEDGGTPPPMEQSWLMLGARMYLPTDIRKHSYDMFNQFCEGLGIKDGGDTWFMLMQNYRAAANEQQIMDATIAAYEFIQKIRAEMPQVDDHAKMAGDEGNADLGDTARQPGQITDMFDEKAAGKAKARKGKGEKGDGQPGAGVPGDGEGEEEGEGEDGKGTNKNGKGKPGRGQSDHGDGSEQKTIEQQFSEMIEEMREGFQTTIRNDGDVKNMARDANTHSDRDGLPEYHGGNETEMSPELQARAMFTAQGIKKALNTFVTTSAPIWETRKERGVIDPLIYRTKQHGDREFRRHLDNSGNIGLDVHVSMLCDVSGSMHGGPMQALSESLYATALACQELEIGATFTLWSSDTQNYRVWADGKPTPSLWPSMGGTDPTKALDDLGNHNPEGASSHLVVIFTDGQWSGAFPSIQRWGAPDRTFVLVRYGAYDGAIQKDMGADAHIAINDVRQLPELLTQALIQVLSAGTGWGG